MTLPDLRGRSVAIVGTGPSLRPPQVDLARAAGYYIIGIHGSGCVLLPHEWLFTSAAMGTRYDPEWLQFPGLKTTIGCAAGCEFLSDLVFLPASRVPVDDPAWTYSDAFAWCPSGVLCAAIHAAVKCGAAEIALLGVDGHFGPAGRKHWHDEPDQALSRKRCPQQIRLEPAYRAVATMAAERGVGLRNLSPGTQVDAFERADLEEVLAS